MYTAVVTRILGSQQITTEYPCRNIDSFWSWSKTLSKSVPIAVSCPYGLIVTAQKNGEYIIATLHRNT